MKVLIGYDGSRSSEFALHELGKAGLPARGLEVELISIAEVWIPVHNLDQSVARDQVNLGLNGCTKPHEAAVNQALEKAESACQLAAKKIQQCFPTGKVGYGVAYGSPSEEILNRAEIYQPELIIVGSQGQSAISRVLLGSVSRKVMTDAQCSVRIAREKRGPESSILRVLIGFDGSPGAEKAVEAVAKRVWQTGTKFRLILAPNTDIPATVSRFMPPESEIHKSEKKRQRIWAEHISQSAIRKLTDIGCDVELEVKVGDPKQVIIEEAQIWRADCIFVGSYSYRNERTRSSTGCIASAIAERAGCSVEVVRFD